MPTSSKKDIASFLAPSRSIGVVAVNASLGSSSSRRANGTTNNNSTTTKQKKRIPESAKLDPQVQNLASSHNTQQQQEQGETVVTLPRYGNLAVSTGSNVRSVISSDTDYFPRGFAQPHNKPIDIGGFRCTSRGGARVVALPEVASSSKNNKSLGASSMMNNAQVMSSLSSSSQQQQQENAGNNNINTPDVSMITQPTAEVKLRDVWKFGMRAKAPLLTEIDPSEIGRAIEKKKKETQASSSSTTATNEQQQKQETTSNEKIIKFVRIQPEFLHRGMVQPPQAQVVEVDPKVLEDDAAHLMNPRQRRELMESQRKAREGLVALREVQAAKTKLSRTCQKLYPHGCLGVVDGPYSTDPDQTAYSTLSKELASEATKVSRTGKKEAGGYSRPHNTADVVLNRDVNSTNFFTGQLDETKTIGQQKIEKNYCGVDPTRTGGLRTSVECRPKDQLRMFAVGV